MKLRHPDNPRHVIDVRPEAAAMYRTQGWVPVPARQKTPAPTKGAK